MSNTLSTDFVNFINKQKIFFVGTANESGPVNISPKGLEFIKIIDPGRIVWLNLAGSTNRTSDHVQSNQRMTIMFTAFEDPPLILRLFGNASVYHPTDTEWSTMYSLFEPQKNARQIFDFKIQDIEASCGFGIPYYDYKHHRNPLLEMDIKEKIKRI